MSEALKNKKILIVDDEQAMLEIVKAVLKRVQAVPFGANNIQKAMQILNTENFDAIILDRYMPDGDGHDVLQALKSEPRTKTIPVIMLTGEKDMNQIKASLKLGAVGYIAKPFTPQDFLNQLDRILNTKAAIDLD